MTSRNAVVVGGNRTPFVKAGTKYAMASAQDLMTAALDGLVARFGLAGQRVGEVVGGAVLKHTRDFNLTRESVLGSSLSALTPACDLQQACCTGLEAVVYASNKIRLGQADTGIAGGVDSASDAPIVVTEGLRRAMLAANRARTLPARLKGGADPADRAHRQRLIALLGDPALLAELSEPKLKPQTPPGMPIGDGDFGR